MHGRVDQQPPLFHVFSVEDRSRNRGQLLSAALTILRGWIAAGRPTHGLVPWGSYEGWSGRRSCSSACPTPARPVSPSRRRPTATPKRWRRSSPGYTG